MPLPYTGSRGELNFEADIIETLIKAGWEKDVLRNKTIPDLIENWKEIIFERNRTALNDVPLSSEEMDRVIELVKLQANTPVKANQFINGRHIAIKRDSNSPDTQHAGNEVYLDLFAAAEIAGGSSRYQIAEQTYFATGAQSNDRRGDITLLINGMPVIHLELKASGIDVDEATNQITKYAQEGVWRGFMGLVQVFWAITPEDAVFFANAGEYTNYNPAFFFRWGDLNNNVIKCWRELILGESHILSIPEAHKLIGYYTVADKAKDVLKVCRSYQYSAIRAIVGRTAKQKWGDHNQLGGFVWCTTGGGKTMTSFKAGQLITDMNLADKVVFVVDRKVLDEQSTNEYNSFQRAGESVCETFSSMDLFNKLASSKLAERLIVTSIQKISRISDDAEKLRNDELTTIKAKRIVFIIDEAHRSQFGLMHERVKQTFYNALFFGFTGTPIFAENMKAGELTTETVFGDCLAVYSLATGIRDGNVLGFWPEAVKTYADKELKEVVALAECHATKKEDIEVGSDNWKLYRRLTERTPMASELDDHGQIKRDKNGHYLKGIEDYLPGKQYDNPKHRESVVGNILDHFMTTAFGERGTRFHGILATESIPEAYEYWKLFQTQTKVPDLHVTALFDPNINANGANVFNKEKALTEIVDEYNKTFGTDFNRKTDPNYALFKSDLTARLAHKDAYKHIGDNHAQIVDIVIVVDQLLTGFDSQWLNVLYLDKVMDTDNIIQAISRTNRVLNKEEKPWGMVKFYRKPYTMKRNLKEALRLYCQGDYTNVEVGDIEENIDTINATYKSICEIFAHDKIQNFDRLPKKDEDRQMFRKKFYILKSTLRAAILQGFKWTNEYGAKVKPLDERTYHILGVRYKDLPSNRGGGGASAKPGYVLNTDLSTMEMDKIDAAYLEAQFKIVTMKDIINVEKDAKKVQAIHEIEANLGILSEIQQKYAHQILDDIKSGTLELVDGKTFLQYIQEYQEKAIRSSIHSFAENIGLDEDLMFELYTATGSHEVDELKLEQLEATADNDKLKAYYQVSVFKAKIKLHQELKEYIESRKADT